MPEVTINPLVEASDDSEDEDYQPAATKADAESGSESGDAEIDSGDEKTIGKALKGETELGLVKTRAQRAQESTEETSLALPASANSNHVDALWAAMNAPTSQATTLSAPKEVHITRTYEFAGKVHTEDKIVLKDSQEAKDHLASVPPKICPPKLHDGKPLRRVMKRKSILEDSTKPKKINTLEKSRMEWSGFVDQEGINEDLKRGNKNGYLDKQDFLQNSESVRYQQWKAGQQK